MTKYFAPFCVLCFLGCTTDYQAGQPDGTVDATDAVVSQDATVLTDATVQDGTVPDGSTDAVVSICGNGVVTGTEQCDGQDFGVLTCGTFGFVHGALMCNSACAVDTSGCSNTTVCGDGIAEGTEECDQDDFRGVWCGDVPGFVAGQLVCTGSCTVSTTLCLVSVCGDEITTAPYEQCDGPDMGGLNCQDLGFDGGTLDCATDCTPNTTDCTMDPVCGDGTVDPGEECDEGITQGEQPVDYLTCEDFGLDSYYDENNVLMTPIMCGNDCTVRTYWCVECGNGVWEQGEDCDGSWGRVWCQSDPSILAGCTASCQHDFSMCP